jgi:RimJ/RimL family protein N-acetyltransferase
LRLLFGHDADVTHWVCERIPHTAIRIPHFDRGQVLGPCAAIGVLDEDGRMIAGVVYHNYDPFLAGIEVSCASDGARWANRETFRALLRYPFTQLRCARITAATPRRATSTRQFLEGLGFVREGSLRRAFGDDNAIVYGLLREDWEQGRFCRPRASTGRLSDGQEIGTHAAASA